MARRQVNIFINGRAVENTIKGIRAEKRKLNSELNNLVRGTAEYEAKARDLKGVNKILDDHRKKIGGIRGSYDKISAGVTKFAGVAGIAFGVSEVVQYGRELFKLGAEMEQLNRKAATVFGQALPAVTRAARENAAAMGLTNREYIAAATNIGDLLIPMGFQRDEAANLSTELVNLSGALSEWTGGQIASTDVTRILSKALLGEREELKQLGIQISEADVKARLLDAGLQDLTGEMLAQAKAAATLELITERSADAQAAYAKNSDSLVRRQAELAARFTELRERLATALIPIFEKLVGVANSVADALEWMSSWFDTASEKSRKAADEVFRQRDAIDDLESSVSPLVSRYEELSNKTVLSAEEQGELANIIADIGDQIPEAITQVNEYGKAIGINAQVTRDFVEANRENIELSRRLAIEENTLRLKELREEQQELNETINRGTEFQEEFFNLGSFQPIRPERLRTLNNELADITNQINEISLLQSQLQSFDNTPDPSSPTSSSTDDGGNDLAAEAAQERQRQAAERAAEERRRAQQRELEERANHLARLSELISGHQEEQRLDRLSDDERRLEEIRLRYQREIDIATELEAAGVQQATEKRIELERLRDEELNTARIQINDQRFQEQIAREDAQFIAELERERAREEQRREIANQINEEARQYVFSEQQLAIIQVNEHYDELLALAEEFGVDTLELEFARRKAIEKINADANKKDLKDQADTEKAKLQATAKSLGALSNLVSSSLDFLLGEQAEASAAGKAITLINIGIKSAEALAAATAAAAGVPFPGNLVAIASGVATVFANMAQARQILSSTPDVEQRKDGRYARVRGADDRRTYNAELIGRPGSGMLPDHPVLIDSIVGRPILASERGNEYFVANHDLQNPAVFQHVRAIDNLVRQRVDGGFASTGGGNGSSSSTEANTQSAAAMDPALMVALVSAIDRLNDRLDQGIISRYDDDEIINFQDRFAAIQLASGRTGG